MTAKLDLAQFQGFTPGPWSYRLNPDADERRKHKFWIDAAPLNVPPVFGQTLGAPIAESRNLGEPDAEANARLQAAAPDLLALARDLEQRNAKLAAALHRCITAQERNEMRAAQDLMNNGHSMEKILGLASARLFEINAEARAALADHDKAEG